MKKSLDAHAARFDDIASDYDEDRGDEYRAAVSLVVDHAAPEPAATVLDLGCGTGAVSLALAPDAGRVIGRDISEGMLEEAREKAAARDLDNVDLGEGRFRAPSVPDDADVAVITSNFAMHHLADEEKREAIDVLADLAPQRIVLGDVMFFGDPDPSEPFYSPEVDDPATVGDLADAFTDAGYALTAVERVHDQVGVLVAERAGSAETQLAGDRER
jgi:SAM-dependent methyltransferase